MSLRYAYAIAAASSGGPVPALEGIDGGAVRAVGEGALTAFVSDVPESEFGEDALNAHVRDMEWLTPRAVRHQDVNAALAGACDALVPLSFGAVFRDDERVRTMLRERASELGRRLDALRGKAEWIALVRRDEPAAVRALEETSAAVRAVREELAGAPPGRGYLLARRLDETKRQELRALDAAAVAAATAALERAGATLYREPLVAEGGAGMLARYSALAPRADEAALDRAADDVARDWVARGYRLELSGPWPAYRFATVDLP